jgi:hypothetical protein
VVLSLLLVTPQAFTFTAAASAQTVTITVSCSDALPAMDALRSALDDDAAAAELLAKLKEAARQGRTIGAEDLDRLTEDVMAGLESGVDQAEQAVVRTGNRIEKLNLSRRQGRMWPEHTKSVRAAANQLRQNLRRVPRSGKPMRFVNGRRAVSESRGFEVSPQARASQSARPTAATEPFNRMFQSANGFWTAVKDSVDSAKQAGLDAALGNEEPFMNLLAQVPRLGENVEMLSAARGLAGVGFQSADEDVVERNFNQAREALDRLERTVRGACAQQTTESRQQQQQPTESNASPGQASGGGPNYSSLVYWLGGAVGGGLLLGELVKPKDADTKQCGPKPPFSIPPSSAQISAYRSWCQCLGYRTSGTASNGDYTCLN